MHKLPAGQLCVGGTNKAISASSFIAFIYLINLSSRDKLYSIQASQLTSANCRKLPAGQLCAGGSNKAIEASSFIDFVIPVI